MREWLSQTLSNQALSEESRGYVMGRGAKPEVLSSLGITEWAVASTPAPDPTFAGQFGKYGEKLEGMIIIPLRSPRGDLLGFEARHTERKQVTQYRIFPEAHWTPVWIGCFSAMDKIWKGGTVWVVEGVFDLFALNWAVPDKDVVLASLRARLTKNHINFLQRYASSVNLVYDRDEAGRVGTHRALKDFRSNGIDGRDFPYNGGKDPGELWDRYGSQGLIKSFSF